MAVIPMKGRKSGILSFIHCRRCAESGQRPHIEAGLISPSVLRIWCRTHDALIVDLALAGELPMRCDVCGKPITPDHTH